jgi:hypothetical protein|tara:strand:+ start:255 stop:602 length:348 start_codon:yes stop_codon:yes gene_type:complete
MTEHFQKNIQNWVTLDNQVKNLQQQVKVIRNTRNELTNEIFIYAENNNLENAVIQITDGKLKFQNVKQTSPLTWSLVKKTLIECLNDDNLTNKIIEIMKSKRDIKYSYDIKRTYT